MKASPTYVHQTTWPVGTVGRPLPRAWSDDRIHTTCSSSLAPTNESRDSYERTTFSANSPVLRQVRTIEAKEAAGVNHRPGAMRPVPPAWGGASVRVTEQRLLTRRGFRPGFRMGAKP